MMRLDRRSAAFLGRAGEATGDPEATATVANLSPGPARQYRAGGSSGRPPPLGGYMRLPWPADLGM